MEFNLQTFPRWNPYACEADKRQYVNSCLEWLQNWKKEAKQQLLEAQEKKDNFDKHSWDNGYYYGYATAIKEMLGGNQHET